MLQNNLAHFKNNEKQESPPAENRKRHTGRSVTSSGGEGGRGYHRPSQAETPQRDMGPEVGLPLPSRKDKGSETGLRFPPPSSENMRPEAKKGPGIRDLGTPSPGSFKTDAYGNTTFLRGR